MERHSNAAVGTPLVSIVVAAFRHQLYIERCLASITNQSHERLEIILVDDNSPDDTLAIAESFLNENSTRFERIRIVRNRINRGAHFSLNRGMALSGGDFISLMNSDDTYNASRVSRLVTDLQAVGADWAFTRVATIDEHDQPFYGEPLCHHISWRPHLAIGSLPSVSWGFIRFQLTASTGNLVLTRHLANRIGGFADLKYCHDWDFVLRASFLSEPLFIDVPLYNYRVHGANSFRSLSQVAPSETQYCLRNYFRMAMSRQPPNPLAPSPSNWPTYFYPLVQALDAQPHLDAIYTPYQAHHRTVDPQG